MMHSASEQCQSCIATLKTITSILSVSERNKGRVRHEQASNELERLCLWAGNIGALHMPKSPLSLESRLREADDILTHIKEMLDNLHEAAEALLEIISGDREGSVTPITDEFDNELEQIEEIEILEELESCITRLFRVSSLIHQAAPTDIFTKALSRNRYRFNDQFDIAHVGEKYPKLAEAERVWLRERLGRAITQRRHYLSYIQDHRDKLENAHTDDTPKHAEPNLQIPDSSSRPSTFFTKASKHITPQMLIAEDESDPEDDTKSYTTISRSLYGDMDESTSSRIPILKELQLESKKEIECPFCYRTKKFKNERQWRRHVFSDLRCYICTFPNCDAPYFRDVNEWFRHEMELHRVNYTCRLCQHEPYQDKECYLSHIRKQHSEIFIAGEEQPLLDIGRSPGEQIPAQECPCCTDWSDRLKKRSDIPQNAPDHIISVIPTIFKRHLASHLEQLALFAIPVASIAEGDADSNMAIEEDVTLISDVKSLSTLSFDSSRSPSITSETKLSDTSSWLAEALLNAAGNEENGRKAMKILLGGHGDEAQITEDVLIAVARNIGNGREVMNLLFEKKGGEVQITKGVIMAAAENDETARSTKYLLQRKLERTQITDEALLYADGLACWGGAGRQLELVVEVKNKLLGPEHPSTLASMSSLVLEYNSRGRLRKAESLGVQTLEIKKKVLGPEHPDTLDSMANLTSIYQRQERWEEDESLQVQILEIKKRVLGPEHPDTLDSMAYLTSIYQRQGRWEEAEPLQVQILEIRKRVRPEHRDTLDSMTGLALIWHNQGRTRDASGLMEECAQTRTQVLGPEHPDTLRSMGNLAVIWHTQGRTHDASELMKECAEARMRVLGSEHPDTQWSLSMTQEWETGEPDAGESNHNLVALF